MASGWQLEYRGLVEVKGKGEMETYFVMERGEVLGDDSSMPKAPSLHSSLAAVVYGMVQARRRHHTSRKSSQRTSFNILLKILQ